MNKVTTIPEEPPVRHSVSTIPPGTVFRYWNGNVIYMKTNDDKIIDLSKGIIYTNPSDANVVIFPAVKIQAEP